MASRMGRMDSPSSDRAYSTRGGTSGKTVMDAIFTFLKEKGLAPKPGKVYAFSDVREAIRAQDASGVDGKIVVTI